MMNRYMIIALLTLMGGSAYGAARAKKSAQKTPQQQFASLRRKFANEVLAGNQKEALALLNQHKKTLEAKTNPTLHKRLQEAYDFVFEPTKVKNVDNKAILWSQGYNPKVITNEEAKKQGLVVIDADYGKFRAPIAVKPESARALTGAEEKREALSLLGRERSFAPAWPTSPIPSERVESESKAAGGGGAGATGMGAEGIAPIGEYPPPVAPSPMSESAASSSSLPYGMGTVVVGGSGAGSASEVEGGYEQYSQYTQVEEEPVEPVE